MNARSAPLKAFTAALTLFSSGVFGIVVYALAMFCVMGLSPRRAEGIRQAVDLPWPMFALSPTVIADACLWPLDLLVGCWPKRFYLIVGFSLGVALATYCGGIDLLRRDYIGKF